jgi:D-alanyl-D-alanine carboxypeptidase
MLVNRDKLLPAGYKPPLESLPNGLLFDRRAIGHLNAMISAAQAQGLSPVICSAYRTIEYQQTLFDKQIQKQMARGLNRNQAEIEAARNVAYPGTSEHHLGLAVDIVSLQYQQLDEAQARTPEIIWLTEHCSEYGFILRYPKDKTQITGIVYEPWHFRYVGVETAKVIMEQGLCLEEYLELMRK